MYYLDEKLVMFLIINIFIFMLFILIIRLDRLVLYEFNILI